MAREGFEPSMNLNSTSLQPAALTTQPSYLKIINELINQHNIVIYRHIHSLQKTHWIQTHKKN